MRRDLYSPLLPRNIPGNVRTANRAELPLRESENSMFRKIISFALCATMLLYAYGCTSTKAVSVDDYRKDPTKGIEKVLLTDGSTVEFDVLNGYVGVYKDGEIVGIVKNGGGMRHIPVTDVQAVYYSDTDTGKSVLLGGGILVGAAIVLGVVVVVAISSTLSNIGGK